MNQEKKVLESPPPAYQSYEIVESISKETLLAKLNAIWLDEEQKVTSKYDRDIATVTRICDEKIRKLQAARDLDIAALKQQLSRELAQLECSRTARIDQFLSLPLPVDNQSGDTWTQLYNTLYRLFPF